MAGNRNIDPEVGKATQFKPGNPGGGRPKGTKNWSTVIRELVEDEDYEIKFQNGEVRKYPAKIIADVMARKASSGDVAAATWLIKSGYGDKVDITSMGEKIELPAVYLPTRKDEGGEVSAKE